MHAVGKEKNLPVDLDLATFLCHFCPSHIEENLRRLVIKKPCDLKKLKPDSFSLTRFRQKIITTVTSDKSKCASCSLPLRGLISL